jgi:YebC/PmpR family DNA-binding regulatory protein
MAGHSHWKSIKHKKGAADARRGKLFSKLAKYIMVAARNGGGNPADNLPLRYAIDKARAESMPKDSIERAIKKGTGELQGETLHELVYEGIAPGGTALVIEVLTDNRNRTGGEIRNLLEKRGGSLGKTNSVLWKFEHKGVFGLSKDEVEEDEILEVALDAGADNIEEEEDSYMVYTGAEQFDKVRTALQTLVEKKRGKPEKRWGEAEDERPCFTRDERVYLTQNPVPIDAPAKARQVLDLLSEIEDHDDVQNVFSDFDIPDEVLHQLATEEA